MGLLATRASRHGGAPRSERRDGGRGDVAAPTVELREVHPFSQVFSKHGTVQTGESNYSPIKHEGSTRELRQKQPATVQVKEAKGLYPFTQLFSTFLVSGTPKLTHWNPLTGASDPRLRNSASTPLPSLVACVLYIMQRGDITMTFTGSEKY